MVDENIAFWFRWINEIYPFKKYIAKSFQMCVEVPFNPKCIDFCNTFIDDNHVFHSTFKIFLCVSNIKKVMILVKK
jgi:hypothetical protein